ncbi:MAG: putative restriction endonuclease [Paracoccaceae bacterium]
MRAINALYIPQLEYIGISERQALFEAKQGIPQKATVATRIGQGFFREMILTSYKRRSALTGNDDARLLNASHIVGWAEDESLRLNPSSGIALNALHDRVFDRHQITFDEDYQTLIHDDVPTEARKNLERVETRRLTMPARFLPEQAFLERHRQRFYSRSA